jgi:hypothetical protein
VGSSPAGTVLTITVGSGGAGAVDATGSVSNGGAGAGGYVVIKTA